MPHLGPHSYLCSIWCWFSLYLAKPLVRSPFRFCTCKLLSTKTCLLSKSSNFGQISLVQKHVCFQKVFKFWSNIQLSTKTCLFSKSFPILAQKHVCFQKVKYIVTILVQSLVEEMENSRFRRILRERWMMLRLVEFYEKDYEWMSFTLIFSRILRRYYEWMIFILWKSTLHDCLGSLEAKSPKFFCSCLKKKKKFPFDKVEFALPKLAKLFQLLAASQICIYCRLLSKILDGSEILYRSKDRSKYM